MRSPDTQQPNLFFYVSMEGRISKNHPLRPIKEMVNACLRPLSAIFGKMYSPIGRPSITPERLLRALLLQVLYSIRRERALVEHLDYNLLFRWFVGLSLDEPIWDPSSFSKNRDRLLEAYIAMEFLTRVIAMAEDQGLISKEHFTVDGTLLEAWASLKSFKPKDDPPPEEAASGRGRNAEVDFHGQKRSNKTHASKTDPEALLVDPQPGLQETLLREGITVTGEINYQVPVRNMFSRIGDLKAAPRNSGSTNCCRSEFRRWRCGVRGGRSAPETAARIWSRPISLKGLVIL